MTTQSSAHESAQTFDASYLARSFQEIAIDVVQGEKTEFLSRWYRAAKGDADLTIWWDGDKRVVKQQLCLYGQVVEWNPIHGTRTGLIVEHESVGEDLSEIIRFDRKAERASVDQAIRFVGHLGVLNEPDRALLAYNFRASPRLHKNARERAMREWAPLSSGEMFSSKRPSFWKNLTHWLFGK